MAARIGLWIDGREAVIVSVDGEDIHTEHVQAVVEPHVRYSGGVRSQGGQGYQGDAGEDRRARRYEGQLEHYFGEVATRLRGARAIALYGPGEAKRRLERRLVREGLGERIVGVTPVGQLSERQLVAVVKARFPVVT